MAASLGIDPTDYLTTTDPLRRRVLATVYAHAEQRQMLRADRQALGLVTALSRPARPST